MARTVTGNQLMNVRAALEQYRESLNISGEMLISADLTHGFTYDLITQIIEKIHKLFTADDVMALCNVWSYEQAVHVIEILNVVLWDNYDELCLDSDQDQEYMTQDD